MRSFPDLADAQLLGLFQRGVRGQWPAEEIDWARPFPLDRFERQAFAQILTPVYIGEQTAMLGASSILPQLARLRQTEAQLYLTTFQLDEARHFALLTQLYKQLGVEPLSVRDLRDMLRYHHRLLKAGDRLEWLWGVLVSDLFAKHFYGAHVRRFPDTLFGDISARILRDEARHLAFTNIYLKRATQGDPEARVALLVMRDELLRLMDSMYVVLRPAVETLGFDGDSFFAKLRHDILRESRRIGIEPAVETVDAAQAAGSAPAPDPDPDLAHLSDAQLVQALVADVGG